MKISIRLKQLLGDHLDEWGFIARMARAANIERHTIGALLKNSTGSVSLETLGKICDFLIADGIIEEELLPGILLGRHPEDLVDALASCGRIEFCIGARKSKEWPGAEYVMGTDSRLQGVLMSRITHEKHRRQRRAHSEAKNEAGSSEAPSGDEEAKSSRGKPKFKAGSPDEHVRRMRLVTEFHLVESPTRRARPESPGERWESACQGARAVFERQRGFQEERALIALGSIKVNPVVELMLAEAFSAEPFQPQDPLNYARKRLCPIFFRYREEDPQPPSFCGGLTLSQTSTIDSPGICYEEEDGTWTLCPCDNDNDAAFLFHNYDEGSSRLHVACGGFSARSTGLMTENLEAILNKTSGPRPDNEQQRIGISLIRFQTVSSKAKTRRENANRDWEFAVVPVPSHSITRRRPKV